MKPFAPSPDDLAKAADLHDRLLSIDAHVDIPLDFGGGGDDGPGCFDLPKAARGKLSAAALCIHAGPHRTGDAAGRTAGAAEQRRRYDIITGIARDYPDKAAIVLSPDELRQAAADGRFAIILSLQNAEPLAGLDDLDAWHERGVSMLGFNFIGNNSWSDSARPYPYVGGSLSSGGLSPLGKAGVERLNDLGVIIDVAQMSAASLADILALSRVPVVASHAAPRARVDVDRNLSDTELRAIAQAGGVVQVVGFASYLVLRDPQTRVRLTALWQEHGLAAPTRLSDFYSVNDPATADWDEERFLHFLHEYHVALDLDTPIASVADYVDAIEHVIAVAGIDHVGIGSDFNHGSGVVGWRNVGDNLNVTAELIARGFSEAQIAQLWGGNFLRVWQQVLDGARPAGSHPTPMKDS
ncbi:peptidase M19 renal dipeptidase [Sphingobium chlorophenolicum L-1]|uniref:Peptidase M19 renal dipeptidase n=1 Tax=Sphingobium chlorophenolicum L-1 TaxID=690566 RepID=F6F1F6_SPHCR|nr:membrane dipeptidase [Sphingobium chlorophenolicum]AEG51072.1 peptidase M19 renal dipeptidase [Sphingobium chlorophenolicum L-1]AEG51372.1 peptidase M19 renal dipeptidase [Sphingobium chlorophenolicum L-1]